MNPTQSSSTELFDKWLEELPSRDVLAAILDGLDTRVAELQEALHDAHAQRRRARAIRAALYGGLHEGSLTERIMEIMAGADGEVRAKNLRQMLADLGHAAPANRVQTYLSRLVEQGRLVRTRPGYYRLKAEARPEGRASGADAPGDNGQSTGSL